MIDFEGLTGKEQKTIFKWIARQTARFEAAEFVEQRDGGTRADSPPKKPRAKRAKPNRQDPFEVLAHGLPEQTPPRETTIAEDVAELQRQAYRLRRGLTQLETKLLFS